MRENSYQPSIDGLRAIAVMTVVLFHVTPNLAPGGFIGVDVFFVISGYLISRNILSDLNNGTFSIVDFYLQRTRRIAPALIVTVAASALLSFLLFAPHHLEQFARSVIYSFLLLANFFFWREAGYFDTSAEFKPLLHLWTLGVEEQFYFLWPTILVVLFWLRGRALPIGLIVLGMISFGASQYAVTRHPYAAFYMTPFRIWEFVAGALCLWIPKLPQKKGWTEDILLLIGLVLIVVPSLHYSRETPFPGINALAPCAGAALAIYAGEAKHAGFLLRNPASVGIGLISYSLYLIHWLISVFYRYWKLDSVDAIEQIGIVLISIALATLMYRYVERPFRHKEHILSLLLSWRSATILALLLITATGAFHARHHKGWPWRLDPTAEYYRRQTSFDIRDVCRPVEIAAPPVEGCTFGADSKKADAYEVVLIGDSHAIHWIPGLSRVFQENGVAAIFIGSGGIIPLEGLTNYENSFARPQAPQFADAIQKLIQRTHPHAVVLSARWSMYFWSALPRGEGWRPYLTYDSNSDLSPENTRRSLGEAVRATIENYRSVGVHTVLIGQVPEIGLDAVECLARPRWIASESSDARCAIPPSAEHKSSLIHSDNFLRDLKKKYPNDVTLYLPSQFLCSGEYQCRLLFNNGSLYRDHNHLSAGGSIELARTLLADLPANIKEHP